MVDNARQRGRLRLINYLQLIIVDNYGWWLWLIEGIMSCSENNSISLWYLAEVGVTSLMAKLANWWGYHIILTGIPPALVRGTQPKHEPLEGNTNKTILPSRSSSFRRWTLSRVETNTCLKVVQQDLATRHGLPCSVLSVGWCTAHI